MRKILMINVLCLVSLTTLLGQTVENRIAPPVNYIRETCDDILLPHIYANCLYFPKVAKYYFTTDRKKEIKLPHMP